MSGPSVSDQLEESEVQTLSVDSDRLASLLKQKRLAKTQFTKSKSNLVSLICNDSTFEQLRCGLDTALRFQEEVLDTLLLLCDVDAARYEAELDLIQSDAGFENLISQTTELLNPKQQTVRQSHSPSNSNDILESGQPTAPVASHGIYQVDRDMHAQLKRVSIPKFNGNKKDYPLFKDAFDQCIDKVACSDGYKMLQLRQHLEGDALKVIQGFSASTLGYTSARKRLDEKFGGNRTTVLLHLDSIRQMRPVNFSDLKILEEFSDRLELSIIALKDAGRTAEFEDNSMFYSVAKSKLSPMNIAHFKRWASLEKKTENLVNIQTWLALEVRFRVEAQEEYEGLYGSSKQALSPSDRKQGHNYATNNLSVDKCCLCNSANHKLADCREFLSYDVSKRWQFAKDKSLCFRCLGLSHRGRFCKNSRRCNVEGCPRSHHILLHGGGYQEQREAPVERSVMMHANLNTAPRDLVAMRIIPIIVDSGHRRLQLNALLDECSTDSYITQSVASELGLHGPESSLNVAVLGGSCELLRTNKVNLNIASLDGQTRINLDAFTVENLTGDLQIVDWSKHARNWPHLAGIDFPKVGRRVYVDILLGLNVSLVHRSLTELIGRPGEPIARLTPLGWTCIGPISNISPNNGSNHFARTFFCQGRDKHFTSKHVGARNLRCPNRSAQCISR